ncbi:MAG: hypothetical protein H6839_01515 [Planctomycetes bacterium]|nr:hypothetical protein [Planctomycetota bacterium]
MGIVHRRRAIAGWVVLRRGVRVLRLPGPGWLL